MLFRGKYTVLGILYTRVKFLREVGGDGEEIFA